MRALGFIIVATACSACGPGRQAAWEKGAEAAPEKVAKDEAGAQTKKEEAAQAWQNRDDLASLQKAINLLEEAVKANPEDSGAWAHLSRAYYFLGDAHLRTEGKDDEMIATFEKGVEAGEHAMMSASSAFADKVRAGEKVEEVVNLIPPEGQDAIYWYAANLGKFAVAKGFTTTLFYKDRIYAVMQHVLSINDKYFHAAPHRYFGAFYAKAPSFAGGDLNKSKEHFDKAISIDPNYFGTKVLYAEYYAKKTEDRELFTKLLNEVVEGDPSVLPELVPEQQFEQKKAKQLMAQVDELF